MTFLTQIGVLLPELHARAQWMSAHPDNPEDLVQAWSVWPMYYLILAEGMDRGKFTAIWCFLENLTEDKLFAERSVGPAAETCRRGAPLCRATGPAVRLPVVVG